MKKKIIYILALAMAVAMVFAPSVVYANGTTGSDMCSNNDVKNKSDPNYKMICNKGKGEADAENVVKNVLNTVFVWTGIIAVIVIIIGGILYIIAQGDPGKITRAKNTILYAVIGLIVSLLAFAIVNFVLNRVKGGS